MKENLSDLRAKAAALPLCPGVYLMKNTAGEIIYVGKSRKLRNRVYSYFSTEHRNYKTAKMVSHVADFDYILCDGEMEALTLENTLIKKYTPHYNIRLKDAKSYPYIRVTNEEYPRIVVTRQRTGGGRFYGPYASSSAAHEVVDTVTRIFALPTCRRVFPRDIGRERPCLYAQMGRCVAPCTGDVTRDSYLSMIHAAEGVLAGNIRETEQSVTASMTRAAEAELFELAARYRDAIDALHRLSDKQKVVGDEHENRDVLALYQDDICGVLAVLSVRDGKLQNKNEFLFSAAALDETEDASALITSYYEDSGNIPGEILTAFPLAEEEYALLSDYLTRAAGHRVNVRTPQRGKLHALSEMALTNARERAQRYRTETERENTALTAFARITGLPAVPKRIEAYDISEIGQEFITAAMVVTDGVKFKNSDYRTFRMKTLDGVDDCGAMREALSRRLAHIGDGTVSLGTAPDLILLDGGVGQVHAVQAVLREAGLSIPVFGMVKDDYHKTRALTDGEQELSIAAEGAVYILVYKIQEEVHRVAVRSVMQAKRKTIRHSSLESIKGIGAVKARKILSLMPLSALRTAQTEEMIAAGVPRADAARIREYFAKENSDK